MNRVSVVLLVALVLSSLWLVRSSHQSRRLYAELDRARGEQARLEAEGKRLQAELEAQTNSMRVDRIARERLKMSAAHAGVTQFVVDPSATGASK